jgi:predicted RNA binding protein YcfA (HicA-like mRNA interferase family)
VPSVSLVEAKKGGSHVVFEHSAVAEAVTVPARRPIKPVYAVRVVRFVEAVRGADDAE